MSECVRGSGREGGRGRGREGEREGGRGRGGERGREGERGRRGKEGEREGPLPFHQVDTVLSLHVQDPLWLNQLKHL